MTQSPVMVLEVTVVFMLMRLVGEMAGDQGGCPQGETLFLVLRGSQGFHQLI